MAPTQENSQKSGETGDGDGASSSDEIDKATQENRDSPLSAREALEAPTTVERRWDEMFNRLVAFREEHGHCLVPNRHGPLGTWVSTQRRHYKIRNSRMDESTPMTQERIDRLNAIRFQWVAADPRQVPWEKRYGELVDFVREYGHAQVPMGWKKNPQLSNWVSTQRQEFRLLNKGRASRLTPERIRLLNDLSFVWEARRGGPRRIFKAAIAVPAEAHPRLVQPSPNVGTANFTQRIAFPAFAENTTVPFAASNVPTNIAANTAPSAFPVAINVWPAMPQGAAPSSVQTPNLSMNALVANPFVAALNNMLQQQGQQEASMALLNNHLFPSPPSTDGNNNTNQGESSLP